MSTAILVVVASPLLSLRTLPFHISQRLLPNVRLRRIEYDDDIDDHFGEGDFAVVTKSKIDNDDDYHE